METLFTTCFFRDIFWTKLLHSLHLRGINLQGHFKAFSSPSSYGFMGTIRHFAMPIIVKAAGQWKTVCTVHPKGKAMKHAITLAVNGLRVNGTFSHSQNQNLPSMLRSMPSSSHSIFICSFPKYKALESPMVLCLWSKWISCYLLKK